MPFSIYKSAVKKVIANVRIRKSGAHRNVNFIRVWKTTGDPPMQAWHDVWVRAGPPPADPPPPVEPPPPPPPPVTLGVSFSPASAFGNKTTDLAAAQVDSTVVTVTASGGTPPYAYNWSVVSWSASRTPIITAPYNAVATDARFSQPQQAVDTTQTATFKCIVTDSLNNKGEKTIECQWTLTARDWDPGDRR